jgi:hypothetical protein
MNSVTRRGRAVVVEDAYDVVIDVCSTGHISLVKTLLMLQIAFAASCVCVLSCGIGSTATTTHSVEICRFFLGF